MKPQLLFGALISFLTITSATYAQDNTPRRQGYEEYPALRGDVKSVVIKVYDTPESISNKQPHNVHTYNFNEQGDVEESTTANDNGVVLSKMTYSYDNQSGLLTEKVCSNSVNEVIFAYYYKYNEQGNVAGANRYAVNGGVSSTDYIYDSEGRLVETTSHSFGKVAFKLTYRYDHHNNKTENMTLNGEGVLINKLAYFHKYTSDNKIAETTTLDGNNAIVGRDVFSYNDQGLVESCLSYDGSGALSTKQTFKYDKQGNRTEEAIYIGEDVFPTSQTQYIITYKDKKESIEDFNSRVFSAEEGIDVLPKFKGGGIDKFRDWVSRKFDIPLDAANAGADGVLIVKFIVERDGSISNIEYKMSPHPSYNKAMTRVLKKSPKWEPGYKDGKPVRVRYILPMHIVAVTM